MIDAQAYNLRLLIQKISIRERMLLLITVLAAFMLIGQLILIVTGLDKHDEVNTRIQKAKDQSSQIQGTLADLKQSLDNPRIQSLQASNNRLLEQLNLIQQRVAELDQKLMSPDKMPALLKELLDQQSRLTLVSFNVLPISTIDSSFDGRSLFYQHSFSMQLEGEFEAFNEYLQQIENLPSQLFWDDLTVQTDEFPKLKIQLKVHTLSHDEDWLNV